MSVHEFGQRCLSQALLCFCRCAILQCLVSVGSKSTLASREGLLVAPVGFMPWVGSSTGRVGGPCLNLQLLGHSPQLTLSESIWSHRTHARTHVSAAAKGMSLGGCPRRPWGRWDAWWGLSLEGSAGRPVPAHLACSLFTRFPRGCPRASPGSSKRGCCLAPPRREGARRGRCGFHSSPWRRRGLQTSVSRTLG